MRLEGLAFSSLKGFNERQAIELRDLNLIYGANSSGKSSLFQALLLLQQSTRRAYGAERGVLEFRGRLIDLGGFRTFVHRHETDRMFTVEFSLSDANADPRWTTNFFATNLTFKLTFGLASKDASDPDVLGFSIRDEDEVHFAWDAGAGALRLADASSSATLVERWVTDLAGRREGSQRIPIPTEADRRWLRAWARKQPCTLTGWVPVWSPGEIGRGKKGRPYGGSLDSPRARLLQRFVYDWYNWASEFSYDLYRLLEDMVYVGPLREFPRRVVTEASEAVGLGVRGERLVLHLARNPGLVAQVNETFKQLDIGYQLTVEELRAEGAEDALGDVAIAVLRDTATGVSVSPADVGFGLSQILPVVVQLVGNTSSLILVEQPEIHLHPKMQSRLADVLIASSVQNHNRILVETHSEHLLMRAQRRLRERTVEGWDASKLGVTYVAAVEGGSTVQDLKVGEDGRLLDPWPDGFFDERLDDLFAGI